ncbi:MAG: YkgJ family cysteine cluster protein [Candidatus Omnitrophota bacterium]
MSPCKKCEAKCCKYFAFQIDTPKNKNDFENIRWYLAHKGVKVFIEKRKWYMDIANPCRYLDENHSCKVYEKRPLVCRDHDTMDCERVAGEFDHDYVFRNMEEFDKYLRVRFKRSK